MGTYLNCINKKYTGCHLKTTELLDCELIGICAVIEYGILFIVRFHSIQ